MHRLPEAIFFNGTPIRKQTYLFQPPPTKTCNQRQTKDKCPASCASRGVLSLGALGCLFSVQESRETVYACISQRLFNVSRSGTYQPIFPDDVIVPPPAPTPASCRIRTTQIYQGVFLFPFFQADSAYSLLLSSPQIKQKMYVDLQILYASLCTIHIPHLKVFPSLGQKVTCIFSVKNPH